MQAEQNVLTMPASAKSISGVGRFLLFMQNNPDFTKVQISSVPGWPPGTAGVEAGSIDAGGGAATTGGRGGGYGGPPGGPPGGGYSAPPGGGSTGGGPPGAGGPPGGGAPGYGGPPIFGGGADAGGGAPGLMSPAPGLDNGAITSGGAPIPYSSAFTQVKPLPTYFGFTVTGVLDKTDRAPFLSGCGRRGRYGRLLWCEYGWIRLGRTGRSPGRSSRWASWRSRRQWRAVWFRVWARRIENSGTFEADRRTYSDHRRCTWRS